MRYERSPSAGFPSIHQTSSASRTARFLLKAPWYRRTQSEHCRCLPDRELWSVSSGFTVGFQEVSAQGACKANAMVPKYRTPFWEWPGYGTYKSMRVYRLEVGGRDVRSPTNGTLGGAERIAEFCLARPCSRVVVAQGRSPRVGPFRTFKAHFFNDLQHCLTMTPFLELP